MSAAAGTGAATLRAPVQSKVDPEVLAIRGRPPQAIRFRRTMIVTVAMVGAVGLSFVAWCAFRPTTFRSEVQSFPNLALDRPANPEALAGLPSTYGEVPRLGQPLPGDLGRPILARQRALAIDTGVENPRPSGVPSIPDPMAGDRRGAELRAARQSPILFGRPQAPSPQIDATVMPSIPAGSHMLSAAPLPERAADPNAQGRKIAFASGRWKEEEGANPYRLQAPSSPYLLNAGSIIAASLVTGLRSDLPGMVTAQVTEPVYDSATGQTLLIPQGARLVGKYDSVVAYGQKRALLVWQRLIFPDGMSLQFDSMPATDPAGYAGLADRVDFHSWALLKGVVVATLLGLGSELSVSGKSDLVQALHEADQRSTMQAADQITRHNLDIQPTITIRPGAPVHMLVARDLILAPWRAEGF